MRLLNAVISLIPIIAAIAGCGDGGSNSDQSRTSDAGVAVAVSNSPRLSGGASSIDALVSQSLVAFMVSDTATLVANLVNHDEFARHIYPSYGKHYPAARDTSEQAREFIWQIQSLSSHAALQIGLRDLGGSRFDLVSVVFREGTKAFDGYKIHEGTRVLVRRADGSQRVLNNLGSIVEMDGRCKFLTYRDRD